MIPEWEIFVVVLFKVESAQSGKREESGVGGATDVVAVVVVVVVVVVDVAAVEDEVESSPTGRVFVVVTHCEVDVVVGDVVVFDLVPDIFRDRDILTEVIISEKV